MAFCAFSLLLFVIPTDKMSLGSRNTPKDLKSYMKFHHINGVMLVSGKDGTPVVVENNETTNKEKIVKSNQLFPTASLQKIMTGTGIYQLQQKKQLNWNTPLSKYFPQVPGSNEITIRELMNHTSGLINNARPNEPLKTQQEQIAYMLDHVRKYWLNISTLFYLNTFSYLIFVY